MATITVPAASDIGAVADEVADNIAADTGEHDAQIAGALRTLATQVLVDVTALEAGTTIAGATAGANGTVRLAGDLAGTGSTAAAPRTSGINSATVPAGGALTTGNVLQVSGASALSYGPVNLAGGANYVTGVLPVANTSAQTFALTLDGVGGTATKNTGIVVTANTRAFVTLTTPGAGVSGTRYAVSYVVGGAGVGAVTVTAKDSAAGDNTVATDNSVLAVTLVEANIIA